MTILASRQHTCIHPEISRAANKNEKCKELLKKPDETGGCDYLNRWKKNPIAYEAVGFKEPVWDIEDLVKIANRKRVLF